MVSISPLFTIVGPSGKYYQYPDTYQKALDEEDQTKVEFTGTLTVTGAQLKAGVDFVTKSASLSFTSGSLTYEFLVMSDNYETLLVTGAKNYDNTVYDYNLIKINQNYSSFGKVDKVKYIIFIMYRKELLQMEEKPF